MYYTFCFIGVLARTKWAFSKIRRRSHRVVNRPTWDSLPDTAASVPIHDTNSFKTQFLTQQ